MKLISFLLMGSILGGCGGQSKSPEFLPDTVLSIEGVYLNDQGEPLAGQFIQLRNYRFFSYIDYTEAAIDVVQSVMVFFLNLAFPFYPIFHNDEVKVEKAGYYADKMKTSGTGKFSFKVRAGDFLRDHDGGINIQLVNALNDEKQYGRYSFVIKGQDTDLGTVRLCSLGGINLTEDSSNVTFQWTAPSDAVGKYLINFGTAADNALVWASEVAGDQTSLTLPKIIFSDLNARMAIEAFYTDEAEKKVSCLSPTKDFSVTSTPSLVAGALATSDEILFKIDSLTNKNFSDRPFFGAFDTKKITLTLEQPTAINILTLHNLKLESAGSLSVSYRAESGGNLTNIGTFAEKRFMVATFPSTVTAKEIVLEFSSFVQHLQEIGAY